MVQRVQYCFRALQDCFQHFENLGAIDYISCYKIFLRAGNNPVVLKNSTEHAESLFIALISACYFISKWSDLKTTFKAQIKSMNTENNSPQHYLSYLFLSDYPLVSFHHENKV